MNVCCKKPLGAPVVLMCMSDSEGAEAVDCRGDRGIGR